MQRLRVGTISIVWSVAAVGCATVVSAPGADSVRLTRDSADVAGCTPAGNIRVPTDDQGLVNGAIAEAQFRNLVVGLGGNTGLVTEGVLSIPVAGIAYRCPSTTRAATTEK